MPTPDVIVVGGGVIGLSVAHAAARRGMKVLVVDPALRGAASGVGAGMLAPVTEAHYGEEKLLALNLASAARYPSWVAELEEKTGLSAGYRRCGTLIVARDADENVALEDLFRFQQRLDLKVERLRGSECRAREPGLGPSVRGGIGAADDHQIDAQSLLTVLKAACENAGVELSVERVGEIVVEGSAARAAVLSDGRRVDAGAVVIAAGYWSALIGGVPSGLLPVRPVKGQLVRLAARRDPLPVDHVIRGADVYLVPRHDGRLIVGATVEEQGEDVHVTAGGIHDLLRDAYELVPGIVELEFVEAVAGLRPGTPDNAPLLGETGISGLIAATGHYRNGILLAPVTGDAVADLLVTGTTPEQIAAFAPHRFSETPVGAP